MRIFGTFPALALVTLATSLAILGRIRLFKAALALRSLLGTNTRFPSLEGTGRIEQLLELLGTIHGVILVFSRDPGSVIEPLRGLYMN